MQSSIGHLDRGVYERFRDHRADAQARLDVAELTNDEFVTLLLDVFALHCEREGLEPRPSEEQRADRLVADGGRDLRYLRNDEIRAEIVYAVGGDHTRYSESEPGGDGTGLQKSDLVRIAEAVTDDPDRPARELLLEELYDRIDAAVDGMDHEHNAGNSWGMSRDSLKAIHRAVGGRQPRAVADGCGFVLVVNGAARSEPIYHRPDPGAPDRPRCRVGTDRHEAARYQRRDPDALDERYRLCRHCDPEFTPGVSDPDLSIQDALASADDLDDLRADGGTVTVENPELFDETIRQLKGIADDLERLDDLNLTASTIHDCARDLEAATRREVDDGE